MAIIASPIYILISPYLLYLHSNAGTGTSALAQADSYKYMPTVGELRRKESLEALGEQNAAEVPNNYHTGAPQPNMNTGTSTANNNNNNPQVKKERKKRKRATGEYNIYLSYLIEAISLGGLGMIGH